MLYLFDGLGSIVGMISDSGNKVNSYDYDIYGVMLNQVEKTGVNNPFKFADGYLDASGYYQFGVRYYDPSLGRWTQQDPVAGSLFDLNSGNRYTYASDDPVNLVDSSGKQSVADSVLSCIVGGFVGGVLATLAVALVTGGPGSITAPAIIGGAVVGCLFSLFNVEATIGSIFKGILNGFFYGFNLPFSI